MDDPKGRPSSESGRTIERNEVYDHNEYGAIEVTGIWRGVHQVDVAHHRNQEDIVIVRYAAEQDGEWTEELVDTINEFLKAIE